MLIPLGNCDMVLGVQWLSLLGPITWDFLQLEMQFKYDNKRVVLHGLKEGMVTEVKAKKMKYSEDDAQISLIYVNMIDENEPAELLSVGVRAEEPKLLSVGVSADKPVGVSAGTSAMFSVGVSADNSAVSQEADSGLNNLLQDYADIFEEPTSLPPHRVNHDHKIPLMEGLNPVNQRPYGYVVHQKTEIDKMV